MSVKPEVMFSNTSIKCGQVSVPLRCSVVFSTDSLEIAFLRGLALHELEVRFALRERNTNQGRKRVVLLVPTFAPMCYSGNDLYGFGLERMDRIG